MYMHKHTDEYMYICSRIYMYVYVHTFIYIHVLQLIAGKLFKCAILGGGFTGGPNRIDKLLFSLKPTDAEHKPKL